MAGERDDFEIARVAALARLRLSPEEASLYQDQLTGILAYVRQIQDVDTAGVPPAARVLGPLPEGRADEVHPSLPAEAALANAPDAIASPPLVRVPKVLDR
jgi:aspartyl-tRNA(Asn)/glutamyl-tRNA(Gln) amidotransferase subunit C